MTASSPSPASAAEEKVLGKRIDYPQHYCPEILVSVPRTINREIYGIHRPEELFCGSDSWHAYEAGFLTDGGMPVCGLLKIVYPASSPLLVESKSLKLYLGSYHMHRLGKTRETAIGNFVRQVETDLERLLSAPVDACFYGGAPATQPFDFAGFRIIEDGIPCEEALFSVYRECPELLGENLRPGGEIKVGSHLLKSNCKITRQPDWGSLYLHLKAEHLPDDLSLLRYIVSLRNENHFHEEICEMTFKRLTDLFHPEILMVACLYTRRGGIDICPVRANAPRYLPAALPRADILTARTFRQ